MRRLNQEDVSSVFLLHDCILLENYRNADDPIDFRCRCGSVGRKTIGQFRARPYCQGCGRQYAAGKVRRSQEEVEQIYSLSNCVLKDTYLNATTPMKFLCECGQEGLTRLETFLKGARCQSCYRRRRSESKKGSKNGQWIDDREEARERSRLRKVLRGPLYRLMALGVWEKKESAERALGYSLEEFKTHLEEHPNMEYIAGRDYEVDHIFPVSAFVARGITDPAIVNSLDNLQPLLPSENLSKKDKYDASAFGAWLKSKGWV